MRPGPRILFINDDPDIRALVADALRADFAALEVTGVSDADALKRAIESGGFDIAITDYRLPWADGSEIIGMLKERWPDFPVVIFSVTGEDEVAFRAAREALAEGRDPGAEPARSIALLSGTVRSALERADLQRQHRWAETALREHEARFRSLFETATDAIVLADTEGAIIAWNRAAQTIFGYTADEVMGRPLACLMPERYREAEREGIARLSKTGESRVVGRTVELHGLRKDGTEFPIELAVGSWRTGRGLNFSGIIRDITERKRVEAAFARSFDQVRALGARVESVREEERAAIARQVHDELGQTLTAIRMDAAWLQKRLATGRQKSDPLLQRLRSMSELLDVTIGRVRRISAELRPALLDNLGLAAAIEWQAQEFKTRTGIDCRVESKLGDEPLGSAVNTALFRIFQECLTNIARHAKARRVETTLRHEGGDLVLEVRDDGRGISEDAIASPTSFGLMGMSERARLLGGSVRVARHAERGTVVTVSLPLSAAEPVSASTPPVAAGTQATGLPAAGTSLDLR